MRMEVFADGETVASEAAKYVAAQAQQCVVLRGRFVFAVSGGKTPWVMLRDLTALELPWKDLHIVQVDERIAPAGDPDRNLTHLQECLLGHCPLPPEQIHAMPVNQVDLVEGARQYSQLLQQLCGGVIDLVHLGLGPDGHTASLVPGDGVLEVNDADVALTGVYQGRRRMTMTYPLLNRSRCILWLVTGNDKAGMLKKLLQADHGIPAGRVRQEQAVIYADRTAAD